MPLQSTTLTITIRIDSKLTITLNTVPPSGVAGQAYSYSGTLSVSGGVAPYSALTLSGSAQSMGLTAVLSGSTLSISGTPTGAGNASFAITTSDSGN